MSVTINGKNYRVADAHAHIYPHKIADKATASVGNFYDIPMDLIGCSETLLDHGRQAGTERYLVCSVATKPEQVQSINRFIAGECEQHPEFIGLAAFHKDVEDYEKEVGLICESGFKGVKLHPDFQRFNIDDPQIIPFYRLCAERGLVVLFHTGDKRYDFSTPRRLLNAKDKVPELKCIAAHFGGYSVWETAFRELRGQDVYFDTSSSLDFIDKDFAVEMIRGYGADKMMYGTDFPMWDPVEELRRFINLDLTEEENKKILYDNFASLFGIDKQ